MFLTLSDSHSTLCQMYATYLVYLLLAGGEGLFMSPKGSARRKLTYIAAIKKKENVKNIIGILYSTLGLEPYESNRFGENGCKWITSC